MQAVEVVRAAIPGATEELADFVLFGRTPFPMGDVTPRQLYRAAARLRRAPQSHSSFLPQQEAVPRSVQRRRTHPLLREKTLYLPLQNLQRMAPDQTIAMPAQVSRRITAQVIALFEEYPDLAFTTEELAELCGTTANSIRAVMAEVRRQGVYPQNVRVYRLATCRSAVQIVNEADAKRGL